MPFLRLEFPSSAMLIQHDGTFHLTLEERGRMQDIVASVVSWPKMHACPRFLEAGSPWTDCAAESPQRLDMANVNLLRPGSC
jgi:hypothetical protein